MESLLLAGLLMLSAFTLADLLAAGGLLASPEPGLATKLIPEDFLREMLPTVALCVALYWAIHISGLRQAAFWLVALFVVAPQILATMSHNQIEWHRILDLDIRVGEGRSTVWDAVLLLVSMVGLGALYRAMGLRQLNRNLLRRGIDRGDRDRAVLLEGVMLGGLVAAALVLTLLMMALAVLLGRFAALLEWSSWSVLVMSGGATVLLALSLALWFRGRRS